MLFYGFDNFVNMQCCVPNCASNELKTDKSENSRITYHEFPKSTQIRTRWIQSLRLGDWRPNANSVVCSRHFNDGNIVQSELQALDTDVDDVPVTFKMKTEQDTEELDNANNICRICLCSDKKVYNIGEYDIAQQYELLTASKNCVGDVLPQYICWECKARLASFARLRSVALRSLEILQEYYENVHSEATKDAQLSFDRYRNNLTSTLVRNNIQIVNYPPKGELLVEIDIKPDNTVRSNIEDRNDNDKSMKIMSKERIITKVKNENDNSVNDVNDNLENRREAPKVLSKGRKSAKVKNENDNLDSNDFNNFVRNRKKVRVKQKSKIKKEKDNSNLNRVNDNLGNRKEESKALSKRKYSPKLKNENDNSDLDNFEDIKIEPASEKSDDINYNSDLEDMIYDSDTTKSENEDINREVDADLAKINTIFSDERLGYIKRRINVDCTRLKNGVKALDDQTKSYEEIEETFSVKQLSKYEQLEELVRRKESDNYKNAGFKCDICYRGFIAENSFSLHQIKHTDVNGPTKCPICGLHFKNPTDMRQHAKNSHQYRYSCNQCEFVTGAINTAKLHVQFHKGTIYTCSQCDKTFQKRSSLLGHVRIHHPSDIVCRLCGYSFVNEKGLNQHILRIHKLEKQVPEDGPRCIECNIQFSTDAALTTHYQESNKHKHEPMERKRRSSSNSQPIYRQPNKIMKKGPVNCELCDAVLADFVKYRWHFKESHPNKVRTQFPGKFICEICGIACPRAAVLEEHKLTHSDIKQYSCDECKKQFKTKLSLYNHKERHLKKKYSCDICDSTFSSMANMKRHKIVHKNLKFDCNICDKSFNTPYSRKNHMDYIHLEKPWPVRHDRVRKKQLC